jgi:hypothetical protein
MKKFFAIIAAVCLFGAMNVFAGVNSAGNEWTSGDESAHFSGRLLCVPTFEWTNGTLTLGNFFNQEGSYSFNSGGGIYMQASLMGPSESAPDNATYTITYTFGNATTGTFYTTGDASLSYPTQFPEDNTSGLYLTGDWSSNGEAIGCDNAFTVKFVPNTLVVPSSAPDGAMTFTITIDATVTL